MSSFYTISCIIPSTLRKKSLRYLSECLTSLQDSAPFTLKNILTTNSPIHIQKGKTYTYVDFIVRLPKESGFSELNNAAIDLCILKYDPKYIILINDDAFVAHDFFAVLGSLDQADEADIIVPLVYTADGKRVDSFGVEYFRSGYAKNSIDLKTETTLGTAGCLIVKTALLRRIKMSYGFYFNPILHFYLEDVDFCMRAHMLGAQIKKNDSLKAYHHGSSTTGKKSYFTMYQTYRNIVWILIMNWPMKYVLQHSFSIMLVQSWCVLCSFWMFGPKLYMSLIWDTFAHLKLLLILRSAILPKYKKNIAFSTLFSSLTFRTYHGLKIKVS